MDIGFEREIKTISGAVRNLAVSENKVDFYSTMMYTASTQETYEETSGKFVKKYLKVSKYCGDSNGDCFGDKYYNYNDTTHKKEIYEPVYKGACASLKNGASICITPQSSAGSISGLIDINGKKGPNVFGRDLRSFTIDTQFEKTSLGGGTSEVLSTPESDLEPKKPEEPEVPTPTPTPEPDDPCAESSISKACCDTKNVKKGDACCIHYQSQVGHPCYEAPEPTPSPTPTPPTCNYNIGAHYNGKSYKLLARYADSDCKGTSFIHCYANPSSKEGCTVQAGSCVVYSSINKSCHSVGLTAHECMIYQGVHTDEAKAVQEKINQILSRLP